jgi:hypothetical protein
MGLTKLWETPYAHLDFLGMKYQASKRSEGRQLFSKHAEVISVGSDGGVSHVICGDNDILLISVEEGAFWATAPPDIIIIDNEIGENNKKHEKPNTERTWAAAFWVNNNYIVSFAA